MKYIYIDGDDIGLMIEKCFMGNDEKNLKKINTTINRAITQLTEYLTKEGCDIIFSGADGIIFKKQNPNTAAILSHINTINTSITFSIGVGNSLREAFLALRFAKANGKNGIATLDSDFIWHKNTN